MTTFNVTTKDTEFSATVDGITVNVTTGSIIPVSFKALSDTPNTYVGEGNKFLRVKADGTGLEFTSSTAVITWDGIIGDQSLIDISGFNNDAGFITATLTEEQVEDYVGGMIGGNSVQTLIQVSYDDANGELDFVVDNDLANYDNTNSNFFEINNDDSDDITEGVANLFLTTNERAKLGYISVTQNVDLDQLELDVASLSSAITLQGVWDASSGSFPASADTGYSYIVSVGGTVDGIVFTANDRIVAITDSASTTTYAGNWHKLDYTDQVLSVAGLTGAISKANLLSALNVEDGADVTDSANVASAGAVMESDYSPSHSLLVQQSGTGSPSSLSVSNNTVIGKLTGDIVSLTATQLRTLINVENGADVTDATNVASAGAVMESDTTTALMQFVLDEDNMASDSETKLATQQSIKAYVDTRISENPTAPTTYTPSGTTETITFTYKDRVAIIDLGSATGDVTLTINGMVAGNDYLIKTIQGATARNLIFPASVIGAELLTAWDTSTNTLTLTATNDAKDVVGLTYDGTDTLLTAEFNLS